MCDKGILLRSKCLQNIFELVRKEGSYDAVNWNQYPTVPVHDKDKVGLVKLRASVGVWNQLRIAQGTGAWQAAHCDVLLHGKGGFIACHRIILVHASPWLRSLIEENIRDGVVPSSTTPISIHLTEFKLRDLATVLGYMYTGFASFPNNRTASVLALLNFLRIDKRGTQNVEPLPPDAKAGRELLQHKESCKTDDEDGSDLLDSDTSDDDDDTPNRPSGKDTRTGNWVTQATQVNSATNKSKQTNTRAANKENANKKTKVSSDAIASTSTSSVIPVVSVDVNSAVIGRPITDKPGPTGKPPVCSVPLPFVKVAPGTLIHKRQEPRITRPTPKSTRGGRKPPGTTLSSMTSAIPSTIEPVAGCSKTAVAKDNHPKAGYELDKDYRPTTARYAASPSSSDDEEEEESDPAVIHFVKLNRRSGGQKLSNEDEIEGSTLAERIKLRTRVKSGEVGGAGCARTSQHYALRERPPPKKKSNPEKDGASDCGDEFDDSDGSSHSSIYNVNRSSSRKWDRKCYFCKTVFESEEILANHSLRDCGIHLKHLYTYPEKLCCICNKDYGICTHYGLIRHVQYCGKRIPPPKVVPGVPRGTLDYDFLANVDGEDEYLAAVPIQSNESPEGHQNKTPVSLNQPIKEGIKTPSENGKKKKELAIEPKASSSKNETFSADKKISNDEIIPIGDAKVVMGKLSDDLIDQIIERTRNSKGDKYDIPRVPGYNYVHSLIIPKTEMPDPFPDDTPEDNAERIRKLEEEQEDSRRESEARRALRMEAQKMEKMQTQLQTASSQISAPELRRVSPITILRRVASSENRSTPDRSHAGPPPSPETVFEDFLRCSCGTPHSEVAKTLKCLEKRKLRKCWVCGLELSYGNPIENHLRVLHFNDGPGNQGTVACPVCKLALPYSIVNNHCFELHFKSRDLLESSILKAGGQVQRNQENNVNVQKQQNNVNAQQQQNTASSGSRITGRIIQKRKKSSPKTTTSKFKKVQKTTNKGKRNNKLENLLKQIESTPLSGTEKIPSENTESQSISTTSPTGARVSGGSVRNISVDGESVLQISSLAPPSVPDGTTTDVNSSRPSPIPREEVVQAITTLTNRPDITVTSALFQNPSPTTPAAAAASLNLISDDSLAIMDERADSNTGSSSVGQNPASGISLSEAISSAEMTPISTPTNVIMDTRVGSNGSSSVGQSSVAGISLSGAISSAEVTPTNGMTTVNSSSPVLAGDARIIHRDQFNGASSTMDSANTRNSTVIARTTFSTPFTGLPVSTPTSFPSAQPTIDSIIASGLNLSQNDVVTCPDITNPPFLSPNLAIDGMYEPNRRTTWAGNATSSSSNYNTTSGGMVESRPGDIHIRFTTSSLAPRATATSRQGNARAVSEQNRYVPYQAIPNPLATQRTRPTITNYTRPQPPSYLSATSTPSQSELDGQSNTAAGYRQIRNLLNHHLQQANPQQQQYSNLPQQRQQSAMVLPPQASHQLQHQGQQSLVHLQQQHMLPVATPMASQQQHGQIFQGQSQMFRLIQSSQPGAHVTVESQSNSLLQNLFGPTGNTPISPILQLQGQIVSQVSPRARKGRQPMPLSQSPSNVIHHHNNIQINYQSTTSSTQNVNHPGVAVPGHAFLHHGPPPCLNNGISMINQIRGVPTIMQTPMISSTAIQTPQESRGTRQIQPPPTASVSHLCPTCKRLFKTEELFDTHFCSA